MTLRPSYSAKSTAVSKASLDDRTLLAIGKLIRACAEVEDLINLFICNLAEINESRMVVLLGKTSIGRKIDMAKYLAAFNTSEAKKLADWALDSELRNALSCRNSVAHGVLLGKDEDGHWSFLTSNTETPDGASAIQLVAGFSTEFIEQVATACETAIPSMTEKLKLTDLRNARYDRPLSPHRKALKTSLRHRAKVQTS